jgi:hypothetical protein
VVAVGEGLHALSGSVDATCASLISGAPVDNKAHLPDNALQIESLQLLETSFVNANFILGKITQLFR